MKSQMYGLSVCLWGVDDESNNGFFKMLRNRYFYGGLGHAAIKLVIPCTSEHEEWVQQYCYKKDGTPLFPIVKTTTKVSKKKDDSYIAIEEPCYEIYFSWMPDGINTEIEDRLCQINSEEIEYTPRAKALLYHEEPTPKISAPLRTLGSLLHMILHPFTPAQEEVERMPLEVFHEQEYDSHLIEKYEEVKDSINRCADEISRLRFAYLFHEVSDKKLYKQNLLEAYDEYKTSQQKYYKIGSKLAKKGSYGCTPQYDIHLPIAGQGTIGLNVEGLLKGMSTFCKDYAFDLVWLNCSHAVRYILLDGIDTELGEQLRLHMRQWDLLPSSYDNPTRIRDLAIKLQNAFTKLNLEHHTMAYMSDSKEASCSTKRSINSL